MKLRTRLLALALALALALPALVSPLISTAAPRPAASNVPADEAGSQQAFSINGRIASVDYTSNVIVVKAKRGSDSIALTPTTSVDLAGEQGSISDLRPGMHVRVRGTIIGGVMTAESIAVVK